MGKMIERKNTFRVLLGTYTIGQLTHLKVIHIASDVFIWSLGERGSGKENNSLLVYINKWWRFGALVLILHVISGGDWV
jgi:hypothetical protein